MEKLKSENMVMLLDGKRYQVEEIQQDETGAVRSVAFRKGDSVDVIFNSRIAAENQPDDGSELLQADDPGALLFHVEHINKPKPGINTERARLKTKIITSQEAQQILGIKSSRLSKHVMAGDIQPIKRGIYLKADIAALFAARQRFFKK